MRKKPNIEKVIDKLAKEWLGKKGVISISDSEINGELCIVFFVNQPELERELYPSEVDGYKIIIKSSGKVVAHND